MTAATKENTMGGRLRNKDWDKSRRVCDKLVNNHINIIGTTNTITQKYVDNIAAADYGKLGHFLKSNSPCVDKRIATNPIGIRMPDGQIVYSSHTALLLHDTLPTEARHAHISPEFKNKAWLSRVPCMMFLLVLLSMMCTFLLSKSPKHPLSQNMTIERSALFLNSGEMCACRASVGRVS